jgi:hypothetical protein
MSPRLFAALGLSACLLLGCANATFNMSEEVAQADAKPQTEQRQANFFSGFGQKHAINAAKVCGGADKVASVDVNQSFMDAVIATVTLGIYTPLSARVYCK